MSGVRSVVRNPIPVLTSANARLEPSRRVSSQRHQIAQFLAEKTEIHRRDAENAEGTTGLSCAAIAVVSFREVLGASIVKMHTETRNPRYHLW